MSEFFRSTGGQFDPEEVIFPWEEDFYYVETDDYMDAETMVELDLGPSNYRIDADIGPETAEEEAIFADAPSSRYIDLRTPNGVHCMDDRVLDSGLQLPGGILETQLVSRLMNPKLPPRTIRESYERLIPEWRSNQTEIWVHGTVCAASLLKREALALTAEYHSPAANFTQQIMEALELPYSDSDAQRAIYTGAERAHKDRLWDFSARQALTYAGDKKCIHREDFTESHRAAGLRIDASNHLFNNHLFRKEHQINGQEVGMLNVSAGAYKDFLASKGFDTKAIAQEITHLSLFTYGMAKVIGHSSLRAALVTPHERA